VKLLKMIQCYILLVILLRMNGYTGVITDEEWENAVVFISGKMDDETIEKIKEDIKEQGESWWSIQHFGIGMDIRNMLRKGGFDWDDGAIDKYWTEILQEILKRSDTR